MYRIEHRSGIWKELDELIFWQAPDFIKELDLHLFCLYTSELPQGMIIDTRV